MKLKFFRIIFLAVFIVASEAEISITTCDRITQHGYPCERHSVETSDGYILTLFRIPHSHSLHDSHSLRSLTNRPVIFMMHCILCSSDIWVLNGPNDGLAFMLADAGYDVWLGNARGNVYSQNHVKLSPSSSEFWNFSWDEIGLYDLPANIDYILSTTKEQRLHYIGYSQGTTVFMVLQSSKPEYSNKIKSTHLLGPGIFFCHMSSPLAALGAPIFGRPSAVVNELGATNFKWIYKFIRHAGPFLCEISTITHSLCNFILKLVAGWDSRHFNQTLQPDLIATVPADGALRQAFHFLQLRQSCDFKAYDFGRQGNINRYGTPEAPNYNLKTVRLQTPIELYYCDRDYLVSTQDVQHLSDILGNQANLNEVPMSRCNHFDLVMAYEVKSAINNCIVNRIQQYEGGSFERTLCNRFSNKDLEIL